MCARRDGAPVLAGLAAGDTIAWPLPDGREARIRILSVESPAAAATETAA